MTDENKKSESVKSIDSEEKLETNKKPAATQKKVKAKSSEESGESGNKKKIIEKLQAMGVMSGGHKNVSGINDSERGHLSKALIASVIVVLVVGTFVWGLNNKVVQEPTTSNINTDQISHQQTAQSNYSNPWQPYPRNSYNNNNGNYSGNNYPAQVDANTSYEKQQEKWMQEKKQFQEQEQLRQQKWMKQQQQQYEKYMKWVQQQRKQHPSQEQQRWAQQYPNYTYQQYGGYQGQPAAQPYNYAPQYQQPQQYYSR